MTRLAENRGVASGRVGSLILKFLILTPSESSENFTPSVCNSHPMRREMYSCIRPGPLLEITTQSTKCAATRTAATATTKILSFTLATNRGLLHEGLENRET